MAKTLNNFLLCLSFKRCRQKDQTLKVTFGDAGSLRLVQVPRETVSKQRVSKAMFPSPSKAPVGVDKAMASPR